MLEIFRTLFASLTFQMGLFNRSRGRSTESEGNIWALWDRSMEPRAVKGPGCNDALREKRET